mmetsp:Transcript_40983/g.104208  ORF Transcript_40983/g.104208 Transcript_40983/m.104208 type:complete len:504 (-) Transcript_40983:45-1556(-)
MLRWGAALLALGRLGLAAYDYEDIVQQYCHTAMDWGSLPERPSGATELLQVQVFIRHGARTQCTPDFCWDGDSEGNWTCQLSYLENSIMTNSPMTPNFRTMYMPGRNAISGNCLTGQLVEAGFEMEKNNGKRLREAYIDREKLLPDTLADVEMQDLERLMFVRSTDVPRTKQSGMALMSGLYSESQVGALPYLPLKTMDIANENMKVNTKVCPAAGPAADQYFSDLPQGHVDELKALCAKLNPSKTTNSDCFWWLQHLVDCMMSRVCPTVPFSPKNTTLPPSLLSDDAALMRRVWKVVDEVQWGYFHALTRVGAFGALAYDFFTPAEQAAQGSEAPKFLLFSGHDTGPMEPLWAALDLRKNPPFWPPFASMAVLEIWAMGSGPVVRWVSNGDVVVGPIPFAEFKAQLSALVGSAKLCHTTPVRTQLWSDAPETTAAAAAAAPADLAPERPWPLGAGLLAAVIATSAVAGAGSALLAVSLARRSGPRAGKHEGEEMLDTSSPVI